MEYENQDLKTVLSNQIDLNQDHILTIIYNLLCALNFVHSANLVHRDIKPGNVLINDQCGVKICDFGLARSMPSEKKERCLSPHVISRWYRPPEVIQIEKYDTTADIWSLGCILGELLNVSLNTDPEKRHVFKGNSCYPLSPYETDSDYVSSKDQFAKIVEKLDPKHEEIENDHIQMFGEIRRNPIDFGQFGDFQ